MNDPIYFTENIKPICLPRRDLSVIYRGVIGGITGTVAGWGKLGLSTGNTDWATTLQKTDVKIFDTELCQSIVQIQGQRAWQSGHLSKGFNPVSW